MSAIDFLKLDELEKKNLHKLLPLLQIGVDLNKCFCKITWLGFVECGCTHKRLLKAGYKLYDRKTSKEIEKASCFFKKYDEHCEIVDEEYIRQILNNCRC